jgi:hypothetical protein
MQNFVEDRLLVPGEEHAARLTGLQRTHVEFIKERGIVHAKTMKYLGNICVFLNWDSGYVMHQRLILSAEIVNFSTSCWQG